jgi:multicomponent Na+:H+ antiporter subunit D
VEATTADDPAAADLLGTPAALGASILYILHHMLVITTLFLVADLLLRQRRTDDLAGLGGLYRTRPAVALLAMIPIFSLAGVPPLSGFIAKLGVVTAALQGPHSWVAVVALGVGLLTLLSMARVWDEAFWKPSPATSAADASGMLTLAPIAGLVSLTIALSVAAGPVFEISRRAAEQLLQPADYVRAVLGGG